MLSKSLIIVIISIFTLAFIFSSYFTFVIYGETKTSGIDCIPEQKTNIVNCCYKEYDSETGETTAIYCAQCYNDGTGNLACNAYDKVESIKPSDDDSNIPPKGIEGLLGLLGNPTIQPGDDSVSPKDNKGLLGLLDETNPPTFQQQPSLPETTTPQRNIPSTELLSNLDNDNLLTSVPKEDSKPFNLLEENEQQESSPITETDSDNENIMKDEDEEDTEEIVEQQPSSKEQSQEGQEEISINQDEIKAKEVEEEQEELKK
jgi:hypothetical protein